MGDNVEVEKVVSTSSDADNEMCANQKLKIVSWNINGMRTLDMQEILKLLDAFIVMVQETKLSRKQLDQSQVMPSGFSSYFSFSTNRIGYSGVATFCKDLWTPIKAEDGLCLQSAGNVDKVGCYPEMDEVEESHVKFANADGRTVITQHLVQLPDGNQRLLTFINVYCPRLRDDPEDQTNNTDLKMTFHTILHRRAKLLVESGSFVALAGDINISHRWIDHCDGNPKTFVTNEFRKLLDKFVSDDGFVDSFRMLHPDKQSAFTCWNTRLNARENNYGTRIDYIFVDKELASFIDKAEIHPEIMGSDHCPISITFHSLRPVTSKELPSFATKFYTEFKGKQKNLKEFMVASTNSLNNDNKAKMSGRETSKPELITKKRPLAIDDSSKQSSSKRVQTSLTNFFVRNSSQSEAKSNSSQAEDTNTSSNETTSQKSFVQNYNSNFTNTSSTDAWKKLMKAPEVPLCQGHKVPCARRTVKKKGLNFGREFWSCPHGIGKSDDPNANCNFFQWVKMTPAKQDK